MSAEEYVTVGDMDPVPGNREPGKCGTTIWMGTATIACSKPANHSDSHSNGWHNWRNRRIDK